MTKRICLFSFLLVLFLTGTALADRVAVIVDRANVRSGPGTDHDILWTVGKYYPMEVIKESGEWYKGRDFEGDVGWIFHSLVKEVSAVVVTAPLVNIRKGAGTEYRVMFQAEKGVSFKVLAARENWIKIEHADGEVGWIHKSLVWGR
jgi:SH3-like domain-containing protein